MNSIEAVSDGKGGMATASIEFIVSPVNDTPTAADDSLTLNDYLTVSFDAWPIVSVQPRGGSGSRHPETSIF